MKNRINLIAIIGILLILLWNSFVFADVVNIPSPHEEKYITELFESDTHLYLEGGQTGESKIILVDMNDGTGDKKYIAQTDYLYRLSIPTRSGYVFTGWKFSDGNIYKGWLRDSSGTVVEVGDYLDGTKLPSKITAQWVEASKKYTITIKNEKWGTVTPSGKVTVEAGKDLTFTIKSNYREDVTYNEKPLSADTEHTYIIRNITANGKIDIKYYKTTGLDKILELVEDFTPTSGPIASGIVGFQIDMNDDKEPTGRYMMGYYKKLKVLPQERDGYTYKGLRGSDKKLYKVGDILTLSPGGNFPTPFVAEWEKEVEVEENIPDITELFESDTHLYLEGGQTGESKIILVDMNDGTGDKKYIAQTDYLYRLSIPTRSGYVFTGWKFSDGKIYKGWLRDSSGTVIEVGDYLDGTNLPTKITAQWIEASTKYTITITNEKWGTVTPSGKVTVESGKDLTFTIKSNYREDVTYNEKTLSADTEHTYIIRNITANGKIDIKYYKTIGLDKILELVEDFTPTSGAVVKGITSIIIDMNDGKEPIGQYMTGYYKKFKVLPQEREGYTYKGLRGSDNKLYKVGDILTLSPGGKFPSPFIAEWEQEVEVEENIPDITELFESDTHMYLEEGKTAESKIVLVDMNDGTGDKKYIAHTDYLYRLSIPTRSGYVFTGWKFSDGNIYKGWLRDSSGTVLEVGDYLNGTNLPSKITAQWVEASKKYAITITNEKWGTVTPSGKVTVESGKDLTFTVESDYKEEVTYGDKTLVKDSSGKYIIRNITANGKVDIKYYEVLGLANILEVVKDFTPTSGPIASGIVGFQIDMNDDKEPTGRYTMGYYKKLKVLPQERDGYTYKGLRGSDNKLYKVGDILTLSPGGNFPTSFVAEWEKNNTSSVLFQDVTKDDWYYDSVAFVVDNGLFKGVTDTKFGPQNTLTRAMLVTILYRYSKANTTQKATFDDVDSNMYYSEPIAWAASRGIVNGVGNNNFNPDATITRQDFVTILYRFVNGNTSYTYNQDSLLDFTDRNEIASYALEPFQWAVGSNIMYGRTEHSIAPRGTATRAEAATILKRIVEQ